ncbi:MAG: M48 family metalloprotease [Hydrogenophilaceae bacterium]|nr:M48 family metalloprotease [Hydrogenophilaceae bacterium]
MKMRLILLACLLSGSLAQAADFGGLLRGVLNGGVQIGPQQETPQDNNGDAVGNLVGALLSGNTSPEQERLIGQQISGNLLGAAPLVGDAALQRYVNRVGRWVASTSERPDLAWRFGVVESEDINAFAAPGGYVFVTKGLYKKLQNEAELAAVLGHEIGHVVRQHHLKLLQQSQMVAAVGGLLGQRLGNKNQLIQNLIGNGAEIVARSLDKDAEYEADRIGMVLSARAGYDPYALPAVLQEIGHVPAQDSRMALLYKTHPHPEDRLARLGEAVESAEAGLPEGNLVSNRFYRLK